MVGVDEHVWRHTRKGDRYVTVIIDLTSVSTGTGSSRLLAMVEGRSKQAFKSWLASQPQGWRDGIRIVAMDGFTGFKTAATEEIPTAVTVMDPFHVIRPAGDALDVCRRRIQVELHGSRGRKHHPLYQNRRTLHTGADLLTDKQQHRLDTLFADDRHVEVEATRGAYQAMIAAYRTTARAEGKKAMTSLIDAIGSAVSASLVEVAKLGRTLAKRRDDILAFFDHTGSSNGPRRPSTPRLEHLRGSALGFRNLTHYITRSLLEAGGFRPALAPQLRRALKLIE